MGRMFFAKMEKTCSSLEYKRGERGCAVRNISNYGFAKMPTRWEG
jgi:hypothetical protein